MLETDDDIRQALLSGHKGRRPGPAVAVEPPAPAACGTVARRGSSAVPFRPTARPPVAMLTVFDDGKTDGEIIRIRDHRFIIGRTEGDFCIPLDGRISARHLEITHQLVGGLHRWVVTDLQSTHGMFVRVSRTVLADKAEFLVGKGRYRFDAPQVDAGQTVDHLGNESGFGQTQGLDEGTGPFRPPAVTELIGSEIGNRAFSSRMNTGSARTQRARSAGRMIRFASRGTCGCTAALEGPGTPSITKRPTVCGSGCRRSRSNRWPSSRSASNGFSSR